MTLLKAMFGTMTLTLTTACISSRVHVSGEAKCRTIEGDTLCPKLSHLEAGIALSPSDDWEGRVSYDFAQSRKLTWYDRLDTFQLDLPPEKSWLADYGIRKRIDERLTLALEDSNGTTGLPDASHLAFAWNLQDLPWKQSALKLTYQDKERLEAELQIGLGEGERLRSEDGKAFYGLRTRFYLSPAFSAQLAYSEDPDSLSKDAFFWSQSKDKRRKGYMSQRFSGALIWNGKSSIARGLEASAGWQSSSFHASKSSLTGETPLSQFALDPTEILTETLGARGKTTRETHYLSASYRILAEYILAAHWSTYRSELGGEVLLSCQALDQGGNCMGDINRHRSLEVREQTFGLGKIDEGGWSFLLESHEERYDRLYQNFHFRNGQVPRQKYMRLLQARIAWNW